MKSYIECLSRLNRISVFRKDRPGLDNMRKLMSILGDPQDKLKFIHIAGTNGKGSVTLKMSKLFGNNVGIYTSPHLFCFRERIQIDQQFIDQEFLVNNLNTLYEIADKHQMMLTYFEYITAVAFLYFYQKKTSIVCLETGLGGRLDSTNIIKSPILSIITSIGLDHTQILGDTVEQIAHEKAGIIKFKCPVLLGPYAQPYRVFYEEAKSKDAELRIVEKYNLTFEEENNAIVECAARWLGVPEFIEEAKAAKQMCRLEQVQLTDNPNNLKIYLDVGHNIHAIEKVLQQVTPDIVIFGTSPQKDPSAIKLFGSAQIYLVRANHFKAMPIEELTGMNPNAKVIANGNIQQTIQSVVNNAQSQTILIIGSFFIMREARQALGYNDIVDPPELNFK